VINEEVDLPHCGRGSNGCSGGLHMVDITNPSSHFSWASYGYTRTTTPRHLQRRHANYLGSGILFLLQMKIPSPFGCLSRQVRSSCHARHTHRLGTRTKAGCRKTKVLIFLATRLMSAVSIPRRLLWTCRTSTIPSGRYPLDQPCH
jgi:hypothetical protein